MIVAFMIVGLMKAPRSGKFQILHIIMSVVILLSVTVPRCAGYLVTFVHVKWRPFCPCLYTCITV